MFSLGYSLAGHVHVWHKFIDVILDLVSTLRLWSTDAHEVGLSYSAVCWYRLLLWSDLSTFRSMFASFSSPSTRHHQTLFRGVARCLEVHQGGGLCGAEGAEFQLVSFLSVGWSPWKFITSSSNNLWGYNRYNSDITSGSSIHYCG